MGVIYSYFRKKSLVERLECIEEEIKELEACNADSELRHRKITKQLMIYSSGICIFLSILLYFYMPPKLKAKLILVGLLVLSPLIYYVVNKMISWYYQRKIRSSNSRLKDLKREKKSLIDEIMEKETYKVAKEVLEKYAPESATPKYLPKLGSGFTPGNSALAMLRTNGQKNAQSNLPAPQLNRKPNSVNSQSEGPIHSRAASDRLASVSRALPREKGYLELLLEYILGNGPNSRYALICSVCSTHNGMVLMEEFEYTAFKCYSCFTVNPARKQRPSAPKLVGPPLHSLGRTENVSEQMVELPELPLSEDASERKSMEEACPEDASEDADVMIMPGEESHEKTVSEEEGGHLSLSKEEDSAEFVENKILKPKSSPSNISESGDRLSNGNFESSGRL